MERGTAAPPAQHFVSNLTHIAVEVVRQKPWTVALFAVGVVLITYQFTAGRRSSAPQVSVTAGDSGSRLASAARTAKPAAPLRGGSAAEALASGELAEVTPEEVETPPRSRARLSVLDLVGKLAVAALAVYAFAAVTKRLRGNSALGLSEAGTALRVAETVILGPNRALHIVEAAGRSLLIAADSGQVTLRAELAPPPAPPPAPRPARAGSPRRLQSADFVDLEPREPDPARAARRRPRSPAASLDDLDAAALLSAAADDPASVARKREMLVKALQQRAG